MSILNILKEAHDLIEKHLADSQIILLHHESLYRNVLVAYLLESKRIPTIYYALGHDDVSLDSFLRGVLHRLPSQVVAFGRHTNRLPYELYTTEEGVIEIAKSFARDLGEISNQDYIWIIDEYDFSDLADDIQHFIDILLDFLPSHIKILINGRTFPRLSWVSLVAQGKALILQDNQVIKQNYLNLHSDYKIHVKVEALGHGHIYINDKLIEMWDGHLPLLLFFFTLDRPMVTRTEICETFWPEMNPEQAVNVFHVTKRRLHKALGTDALIHLNGYYSIHPNLHVESDIVTFISLLDIARNKDHERPTRLDAWQKAIEVYLAPFLQGYTERWVINRRKDFQLGYIEALLALAEKRIEEQKFDYALTLLHRAITDDFNRQDIHRKIIQLYLDMGRRSEAITHYKTLTTKLSLEQATITLIEDSMD